MTLIVQQVTVPSDFSTTVQNIVDCTSQDIRKVLASSGNDLTILIDYTNRISLDLLRHSRWKFLLSAPKQFSTSVGKTDYWIGLVGGGPVGSVDTGLNLSDVGNIKRDDVIDRSGFKRLGRTDDAPIGQVFSINARPKLWRNDVASPYVLNIYPPSDQAYTIEFHYYKRRIPLTDATQTLQIPNDYKDVVCAGVNWLAYKYLLKDSDTQHWLSVYQAGKVAMIKDANLFPRGEEFIRPDPATLVRQTTTGIGLDSGLETSIP